MHTEALPSFLPGGKRTDIDTSRNNRLMTLEGMAKEHKEGIWKREESAPARV